MAILRTILLLGVSVILAAGMRAPTPASLAAFPRPESWPNIVSSEHSAEPLGPGVLYDRWQLQTTGGPLSVHVTTVDLRDPLVTLSVALQHDAVLGPGEALSGMADRAHAEAGINGDYFDISESGSPLNVVVAGGLIEHQPDGAAALVVGAGNAATIGPVTFAATVVERSGARLTIRSVNDWVPGSTLSILTSKLGSVDASGAAEIVLTPIPDSQAYRVSNVGASLSTLLPLSQREIAIAARGHDASALLAGFALGDMVTVILDGAPPLASIVHAIGGGPMLLRDGVPVVDPAAPAPQETNVRYPVTGAGISRDGSTLWLVAIDGRAPATSVGITRAMFGALFSSFGAAQAMAFDSGGSTEMVVRHLGDLAVSVANTPSDGRERKIADALLVLNSAAPGPVAQLLLRADAPEVLLGSHDQLRVTAIDANEQPVAVVPSGVGYAFGAGFTDCCIAVSTDGQVVGVRSGTQGVVARSGAITSAETAITVVLSIAKLTVAGYARVVPAGSAAHLAALATDENGASIAVDSNALKWSATGDGTVGIDGTFVAGTAAGKATVVAQAGGAQGAAQLLIGDHAVMLAPVPQPGAGTGQWHFHGSPSWVAGLVDASPAPDGSVALRLGYDFSARATGAGATRAAYADTTMTIDGEPLAISLDVFGDGNGEWLRGAYRNADGIVDGVTIARHVKWRGWKSIRVPIPPQARWPIAWTRIYAVEPNRDAGEKGNLWLRNFAAIFAGP